MEMKPGQAVEERELTYRGELDHFTTLNFSFWQTLRNGNVVRETITENNFLQG